MRSFWYPMAVLVLPEAGSYASVFLIRRMLARGRSVSLIYAGDRMWPTIRYGRRFRVEPLGDLVPAEGMTVVAAVSGVPELARIVSLDGGAVGLRGDADPSNLFMVPRDDLLGRVDLPSRRPSNRTRAFRRFVLDVDEALRGGIDPHRDASETVLLKYDTQAPFYLHGPGEDLPASLLETLRRSVRPGGTILVAGCGTGRECFDLVRSGWVVKGVDFAPRMVELARAESRRRGLRAEFHLEDLRRRVEPARSLDAVLFTFDVFSFIPAASERIALLGRMETWLRPDGVILLSARRTRGWYDSFILTLQSLAGPARGSGGWGNSHSRWIDMQGTLHRSFVKVFTERSLRREIELAGLRDGPWEAGHALLRPA